MSYYSYKVTITCADNCRHKVTTLIDRIVKITGKTVDYMADYFDNQVVVTLTIYGNKLPNGLVNELSLREIEPIELM